MANNILSDDAMSAMTFDPFEADGGNSGGFIEPGSHSQDSSQPPAPQQLQAPAPVAGQSDQQPQARSGSSLPLDGGQPAQAPAPAPQAPAAGQPPANSVAAFMDSVRATGAPPVGMVPQYPAQGYAPQPQQPAQAPQQPQGQQPQAPRQIDYSQPYQQAPVQVPEAYMAAIFGEDPQRAAQAMNSLVGTLYNAIMQDVHGQMGMLHQQVQQAPQTAQQQFEVRQSQQKLHDTFYGRHPDLDNSVAKSYVTSIAQTIAHTYAQRGIPLDVNSHEFIDYTAEQARRAMNMAPRNPGQPQQAPAPQAQPRRQYQTGGATRAGGPSNPFADAIGLHF